METSYFEISSLMNQKRGNINDEACDSNKLVY